MALGKIKADTLEHSTAGSLDTQYVVNGSAKAWCNFDGTAGSVSFSDSFNKSSITDDATGAFTTAFTNNMGNANYTELPVASDTASIWSRAEMTTGDCKIFTAVNSTGALQDRDPTVTATLGDLA